MWTRADCLRGFLTILLRQVRVAVRRVRCEPCPQAILCLERLGRNIAVRIVREAIKLIQTGLIAA